MIKITVDDFKEYQVLADKVLNLLIKEKRSSLYDIKIIYNIIMKLPYCLDTEGHYTYEGEWYNSREDLPKHVQEDILERLKYFTTVMKKMED